MPARLLYQSLTTNKKKKKYLKDASTPKILPGAKHCAIVDHHSVKN